MSQENNGALTDQEASDVFNEMVKTLDAENGIDANEASVLANATEDEEEKDELVTDESASAQTQEPEFDFESLSPAAKKKFQELEAIEHKFKSDEGRVGALQRKIDEQRHQLEQMQQQGKGDTQAAQKLEDAIEKKELDLGSLIEDLPELGPLVEELKNLRKQVNGVSDLVQDQVITPGQARAAQESSAREKQELEKLHSDFGEIESNPAFWSWLDSQHSAIKALGESDKSSDVSAVINLYKNSHPTQKQTDPAPQAKKIQRNVDDLISLPNDGNGRSALPTGDDEALFAHYAKLSDAGKL